MARFAVGFRPATAASATLPMASLYAQASNRPRVREVGITNTTATAVQVALVRLSTAGTQGATQTEGVEDDPTKTSVAQAFGTHTVGPTLGAVLRLTQLPAAIGAGVIWVFGGNGLEIPDGTGNGVGITTPTGSGQICDVYFVWDE